MLKIYIEINESHLRHLVKDELERICGGCDISLDNVRIEVKSKQNYKSEWEEAAFRAVYDSTRVR